MSQKESAESNAQAVTAVAMGSAPANEVVSAASLDGQGETLDALENVDFLLEEIENKIAPLALA